MLGLHHTFGFENTVDSLLTDTSIRRTSLCDGHLLPVPKMSVLEGVDCIRHFILVPTSPIKTYLPIFKYRDDVPLGVNNINLNAATRLPFSREVQFSAENNFDMLLDNI